MPGSTLSPVKLRACVGGKSMSLEKIYSPDESSESCAISARPVSTELKCSMLEKFLLYTAVRVLVLHQQCKPCAFGGRTVRERAAIQRRPRWKVVENMGCLIC